MDMQKPGELFYDIFGPALPRLGPGDDAYTRKALDVAQEAMAGVAGGAGVLVSGVIDLGCGTGAQTIQLAEHAGAPVLAVDNHGPYLEELKRRAAVAGVADRITTLEVDMQELATMGEPAGIVWSEGALYVMGFPDGIEMCRSLLVPGGCCAVTEISWLRSDVPDECASFFGEEYPEMRGVGGNLRAIEERGFRVLEHFTLPKSAWWEPYYTPLEERLGLFREKLGTDAAALGVLELVQLEIDMYRRYSDYYGNEFYVMQRA
ncbi:MAG: SAM-dependent methyltransferase [Candidatus Geothermincolia bacterium]